MPSTSSPKATSSLVSRLKKDFSQFSFRRHATAHWAPDSQTVYYEDTVTLLHELGHGLLGHHLYGSDIELITMERAAWSKAAMLANRYGVAISDNDVEGQLDTYRRWLHDRSRCPNCTLAGVQTPAGTYRCVVCEHIWSANDARQCALRRYTQKLPA